MKKILTLLVMFLATASILTAQTPKLSYQMIVRNQCADAQGAFEPNDLVYSADVVGAVTILQDGVEKYYTSFQGSTNMNGMLSLVLPGNVGTYDLANVDWSKAKIAVDIDLYCIHDTVDILPVPYALSAGNIDTFLTTQEIYNYLSTVTLSEVDQIITDFWDNEAFSQALVDTLKNYAKANYGAARNLALYFLEQADAQDADDVYNNIPQDVKNYVTKKLVEFAKNHYDAALEIGLYFIDETTKEDVVMLLDTAMKNPVSAQLMTKVVDSVLRYLQTPEAKPYVEKAFKFAVQNINTNEIQWVQDEFKQENPEVYGAMLNILNSYIDSVLVLYNVVSDSSCAKVDICDLVKDIKNLEESGFKVCPSFGTTTHTTTQTNNFIYDLETKILASQDEVSLTDTTYHYIVSFPSSSYKTDTIKATLRTTPDTAITASIPAAYAGRIIVAMPYVTGLKCRTREIFGQPDTIKSTPYNCPAKVTLAHTSENASGELANYKGIQLTATVDNDYPNKITERGFAISTDGGNTFTTKTAATVKDLKFIDTIKMNYCSQTLHVYAYVICGDQTIPSDTQSFKVRGPELEFVSEPANRTYIPNDTVVLKVRDIFKITEANANQYGLTTTPTVEQILSKASADDIERYGLSTPAYQWTVNSTYDLTDASTDSIQKAAPGKLLPGDSVSYKVSVSMGLFGSTCTVSDSIYVIRGFLCGDTLRDVQSNKYATKQFGNLCWTRSNMRVIAEGMESGDTFDSADVVNPNKGKIYFTPSTLLNYTSEQLGLLYNHKAAESVCPQGWRLPTDADWTNLEHALNTSSDSTSNAFNDTIRCLASHIVKNSAWWYGGEDSGFDAYPAGVRQPKTLVPANGLYQSVKMTAFWAADTRPTQDTHYDATKYFARYLYPLETSDKYVKRDDAKSYLGFSVRCVKDDATLIIPNGQQNNHY